MGKNNLHEFATHMPSQYFHPVVNPWKAGHITGGSSSGSAVAVATGQCLRSIGTDTGGSVRLPAAFCGVVGIKPTFGRESHRGVVTLSWSMDSAGPLARTVKDAAIILQAISGFDPEDPVSADVPVPKYLTMMDGGIKGLRIGVPKDDYFLPSASPEVQGAFRSALGVLEGLGAHLVDVTVPHAHISTHAGDLLSRSETGSFHRYLYSQRASDYGPEIGLRIMESRCFLAHHLIKAQRIRTLIVREMREALGQADVIATPTTPDTAPPGLPTGLPAVPILEPRFTPGVEPGGLSGHLRALRFRLSGSANRPSAGRSRLRRGHHAPGSQRLRRRHYLERDPPTGVGSPVQAPCRVIEPHVGVRCQED